MRSLLVVGLLLCGCGGERAEPVAAEPGDDAIEREATDGAVYLRNEAPYAIEVAYVHTDARGRLQVVRTQVAAGTRSAVSDGALQAGLALELDVVLQVPADVGPRVRRKASVEVDGDVELRAYLAVTEDLFSLLVETVE